MLTEVWKDRVFSHALNTVNKIRTGSQKPPSATRLKLYGLYKQAMGTFSSSINKNDVEKPDCWQRATSMASWNAPRTIRMKGIARGRNGTAMTTF